MFEVFEFGFFQELSQTTITACFYCKGKVSEEPPRASFCMSRAQMVLGDQLRFLALNCGHSNLFRGQKRLRNFVMIHVEMVAYNLKCHETSQE